MALNAQTVLFAAAQTARTTSTPVPPPGSYVYSRWFGDLEELGTVDTPASSETWLAADDKVRCRDRTDSEVVDAAWTVLGEHLLTPQARAAVFEGLATLPGVTVVPGVTVAGRTGIGVTVVSTEGPDMFPETDEGGPSGVSQTTVLVLDPATHELVGARMRAYDDEAGGKLVEREDLAVEPLRVVAKLGVRPDGSTVKR